MQQAVCRYCKEHTSDQHTLPAYLGMPGQFCTPVRNVLSVESVFVACGQEQLASET